MIRKVGILIFGVLLSALGGLNCEAVSAEFDLARFPVAGPDETAFRRAVGLIGAQDQEAEKLLNELLARETIPADAVHWALARILPDERDEPHLRAISKDPESPLLVEALERLALLAETREAWDEAAELWKRAFFALAGEGAEGERGRLLLRWMTNLHRAGETEAAQQIAIRLWTEFAHLPEADEAGTYLARAFGDPMKPVSGEDIFERGQQLVKGGSRGKAVETLTELRGRLKPGTKFLPELDLTLGKAHHFLREYEEAVTVLSRAAKTARLSDTEVEARFYRARSLFGLNRGDEGARDLLKLAKKYPTHPRAPLWLFQAFKVLEGRELWKEAKGARERLLNRYPKSDEAVDVFWYDGWAAYRKGENKTAAKTFADSVTGIARGWQQARGLYWAARSLEKAGEAQAAQSGYRVLLQRYPLGYYATLTKARLAGQSALAVADPRGQGGRALQPPLPTAEDLALGGALSAPATYLRLGMPDAARTLLDRIEGYDGRPPVQRLWLRYWAEDFKGAVRGSGCMWHQWPWINEPGTGADGCRLSFPLAYPGSVTAAAREQDLHPHLLLAVARTESHFGPRIYSSWEARGVMQFIPATAKRIATDLGVKEFRQDDLFEPPVGFRFGARYLKILLNRYDGDVVSAVAAYNGGEKAVSRWRAKWSDVEPDEFVELIPYRETRRYVKKVLTAVDAYGRVDAPGLWEVIVR